MKWKPNLRVPFSFTVKLEECFYKSSILHTALYSTVPSPAVSRFILIWYCVYLFTEISIHTFIHFLQAMLWLLYIVFCFSLRANPWHFFENIKYGYHYFFSGVRGEVVFLSFVTKEPRMKSSVKVNLNGSGLQQQIYTLVISYHQSIQLASWHRQRFYLHTGKERARKGR